MFSTSKISDFQPIIHAKVAKLCSKMSQYQDGDGQVLPLNRAFMALTTDVITEYAFARCYEALEVEGFEETLSAALSAIYTVGQFALHFPVVFPVLDALPEWFVRRTQPEILPVVGMRKVSFLSFQTDSYVEVVFY